jgi:hypothetical protein
VPQSGTGCAGSSQSGTGCAGSGPYWTGCAGSGPYWTGCAGSGPYWTGCAGSSQSGTGCAGSGPYWTGCAGSSQSGNGCAGSGPYWTGCAGWNASRRWVDFVARGPSGGQVAGATCPHAHNPPHYGGGGGCGHATGGAIKARGIDTLMRKNARDLALGNWIRRWKGRGGPAASAAEDEATETAGSGEEVLQGKIWGGGDG